MQIQKAKMANCRIAPMLKTLFPITEENITDELKSKI